MADVSTNQPTKFSVEDFRPFGCEGINLDGFTNASDLRVFGNFTKTWRGSLYLARVLFPSRPRRFVLVTRDLGLYANAKATAMDYRLAGSIDKALGFERICESIYGRLPEWGRW